MSERCNICGLPWGPSLNERDYNGQPFDGPMCDCKAVGQCTSRHVEMRCGLPIGHDGEHTALIESVTVAYHRWRGGEA